MANAEHLAMLRKGVKAWNEWRRDNSNTRPFLIKADLPKADLSGFNLKKANLFQANLDGANLSFANLEKATLFRTSLDKANLVGVDLIEVLGYEARLHEADLNEANLCNATLAGADLSGAKLRRANLCGADLIGANLQHSDLTEADLTYCLLVGSDLTCAELTGASLYGSARDDWMIRGIQCKRVFWDTDGEIRTPKNRDFAPGEFEQLYRALPIIEYIFHNGMAPLDPLIMDWVVQAIREQNPEYDIRIDSINARGLAPSIRFTVEKEEHRDPALAGLTRVYEAKVHELAGRLNEARGLIQLLIDRPNSVQITATTGQYVAFAGSTINIDQHVESITNLRDAVAALPEDSPTFAKVAKKTALDIIGGTLKDVAKGEIKEAAKQIYELGKDLGPVIVNTAAYGFFKSMMPGG